MTEKRQPATMKTINKALNLIGFFLPDTPEWRLSDLARAADMDKVTTMRILNSLAAGGIVEQHPETKKYRLGTAVLRLARIREACFPVVAVLQPILDKLAEETGETTHACLFSGSAMTTIAIAEPIRSTRVFVDPSQALPVHATASGVAFLAYADAATRSETMGRLSVRPHTPNTPADKASLERHLAETRHNGYALSVGTFEEEVTGIAAPIFDWHGDVQATIAAACVASRLTDENQSRIAKAVLRASVEATRAMGGAAGSERMENRGEMTG